MSLSNFFGMFPLGLKANRFLVPFIDGTRRGFHLVDVFHEWGRDNNRVIADEDGFISDSRQSDVVLEARIELCEGRGVYI